jgi:hypothetical protein
MLCICDRITSVAGLERSQLRQRGESFREFARRYSDADGSHPKHTLFVPPALAQENDAFEMVADFARQTGSETEFYLCAQHQAPEAVRGEIDLLKSALDRQSLLSRNATGAPRFAVLGGMRLPVAPLREAGCRADFTPSAPGQRTLNLLHYRSDSEPMKLHRVRADRDAAVTRPGELLRIPNPVCLDWESRRFGVLPRVESGELTAHEPPTAHRLKLWLECHVTVDARPNWHFIALHANSMSEHRAATIGPASARFHQGLAAMAAADKTVRFHYVSAGSW